MNKMVGSRLAKENYPLQRYGNFSDNSIQNFKINFSISANPISLGINFYFTFIERQYQIKWQTKI